MSRESLRVQIDALRIEKQQLEVENVRFREKHPVQGALIDKEAECAHLCAERDSLTIKASQLKSENESLVAEMGQLKAVYEQQLSEASQDQQEKDALQEKCSFQESQVEELSTRCEHLLADMDRLKEAQELKFYRELEKERQKWEARERRLLQQLERAQGSQAGPSSDGGYPGGLGSAGAPLVTSSAGSDIASATVSNHSCTITPSGRDRPATAILSVTMSEPVVSAARTTASWPCGLGLTGSAESSGLMNWFSEWCEWNIQVMWVMWVAQQIPPLQKFDGATMSAGTELITEWLEQFELVAGVCRWDNSTKLVNLVTRLKGEAYSFYKSCTPQQRGSYSAMYLP